MTENDTVKPETIDWQDVLAGLGIGALFALLKTASFMLPEWRIGIAAGSLPCILCICLHHWTGAADPRKAGRLGTDPPLSRPWRCCSWPFSWA